MARAAARFDSLEQFPTAFGNVVDALKKESGAETESPYWTLGLEKPHRIQLPPTPGIQVIAPALASVLLGALPTEPGLLVSLGREVRFALIDSTLSYREYRFNEGGGTWWQREIASQAQHSTRLQTHLKSFSEKTPPLKAVPQLLELGSYPTPDPVLKPRLDKTIRQLAEMVTRVTARLPGLSSYSVSGFLANSPLGTGMRKILSETQPKLRFKTPRFPPEVGSCLLSLSHEREDWEREHLGKDPYQPEHSPGDWAPPKPLLRRLYRMREPFQEFQP